MPTWEIEISDAQGRWGVPPLFKPRGPGVYTTTHKLVAEQADLHDHVYARELKEGETVVEQKEESGEPSPTAGPLTVLDLRPQTVKLKTCEYCGREYKWSHKRCAKRDKAEAKAKKAEVKKADDEAKEPVSEEPELNPKILPLSADAGDQEEEKE